MELYDLINVFKKSLWLLDGEQRGQGQMEGDPGGWTQARVAVVEVVRVIRSWVF